MLQIHLESLLWAGNQGNHQNFEKKMILHMKPKVIFIGKKQKQNIFEKNNSKWPKNTKNALFVCF